jgi:hypothetical protein
MTMTGKPDVFGDKSVPVLLVHHKSYIEKPGIEPEPLRREAGK